VLDRQLIDTPEVIPRRDGKLRDSIDAITLFRFRKQYFQKFSATAVCRRRQQAFLDEITEKTFLEKRSSLRCESQ
jgi:hypothetical protein